MYLSLWWIHSIQTNAQSANYYAKCKGSRLKNDRLPETAVSELGVSESASGSSESESSESELSESESGESGSATHVRPLIQWQWTFQAGWKRVG